MTGGPRRQLRSQSEPEERPSRATGGSAAESAGEISDTTRGSEQVSESDTVDQADPSSVAAATRANLPVADSDDVVPDDTRRTRSAAPTRISAVWTAVVVVTVLLLLLAIFVGQNTRQADVSFLWWHGRAPTAVLLMLAAVAGAALVLGAGIARILQLRRRGGHVRQVGGQTRPPSPAPSDS